MNSHPFRSGGSRRPPSRRRRIPWSTIFLSLLVVGGIGAFFGLRPAWRYVKGIRAERFLGEAEKNFREENWAPGFERIRSALQLAPVNPNVLRAAGYAHSKIGSELGFVYLDALLATPQATAQDREEYVALAIRVGNPELARHHLEELLEAPNRSARTLLLGAQLHAARREIVPALKLAREAVRIAPNNATNRFTVASLLIQSKFERDLEEARSILWPHARTNGPLQLRALGAILNANETPRSEREEIEKILEARPHRTLDEELLLADARISLDPTRRPAIADQLIEKYARIAATNVAPIARWPNRQDQFERTRDLILADVARKDAALFRLRYEALVGLNDIRGAYEFVLEENPPGNRLEVEFARCAAAIRLKDQAAIDSHYRNLIELSKQNVRALRAVAEFAIRNRNRQVANEVFILLSRSPRDAVPALRGLIRNADAIGETWTARDYARKLNSILPREDDSLKLQVAYYDLLLRENIDQAAEAAEALHKSKPEDFNRRAIFALARLRKNEPAKALALVENQVVTWDKTIPGVRAIVAATFGASGKLDLANNAISRTPLATLKPEERDLIKPYLTGRVDESQTDGQ